MPLCADLLNQTIVGKSGGKSGSENSHPPIRSYARHNALKKAAKMALQQSEQEMLRLMDIVPTIIWSMSPDGNAAFVNKVACELTGVSLEDIQNGMWTRTIHPEDRELVSREFAKAMATGSSYGAEHRLQKQDGTWRWFLSRAEPLLDNQGNIIRWFGFTVDIHDRKVAEGRLRVSCGRVSLGHHELRLWRKYRLRSHMN
jgi:PAS domain S-box-containing protein